MSQHDYVIDNQTFPATRTDLNNALAAIVTTNAGATAPSTTYAYQLWYDTTNDILKMRNSDNDAWIDLFDINQTTDAASAKLDGDIDITGTVTADGLTVDGNATIVNNLGRITLSDSDGTNQKVFLDSNGGAAGITAQNNTSHAFMNFKSFDGTSTLTRLRITDGGDISFYDDTGTTQGFFWDASAESLGIGTTSPKSVLQSSGSRFNAPSLGASPSSAPLYLTNDQTSYGLVVGTSALDGHVWLQAQRTDGTATAYNITLNEAGGDVLVGTTDGTLFNNGAGGNQGILFGAAANIQVAKSGAAAMYLNRLDSDGTIIDFRQNGSNVGSIQSIIGARLGVFSGSTAGYLGIGTTQYYAWNATDIRPQTDNARDLGYVSARWDDVYATNGTIQTSDENEKQQIASLTDAEITAAKAISKLFKTFKWNDKVEAKGDAARTHTGVIAQHVQTAMTDAGLDAGDYAFFISTTWWEIQTDVPAVEAVDAVYEDVIIPAVLDDEGNEIEPERTEQQMVTEAVEAQEAYTRTDTYETAEEAPEGATERTRLGIRYPELLAFIGAATEHRLADIETRLSALEGA